MNIEVKVNINAGAIQNMLGLGASKEAVQFLAADVERLSKPYVPMSAGSGAHMLNQSQVIEEGVLYPGPYAHYQYYGEVMAGRAPKEYTGRPLEYHGAPTRGKEWDKRMVADRQGELEEDMEQFLRGKLG